MSEFLPPGPVEGESLHRFRPDTPESYPAAKSFPFVLPSGAKVLLRRPNLMELMLREDIPNPLLDVIHGHYEALRTRDNALEMVQRAEDAGRTLEEQAEWEAENPEPEPDADDRDQAADDEEVSSGMALSFIDLLVFGCYLTPVVSYDPPIDHGGQLTADGKLAISSISDDDKRYVFRWGYDQLEVVARFRDAPEGAGDVSDGGAVRDPAVGSGGDPGFTGVPVDEAVLR